MKPTIRIHIVALAVPLFVQGCALAAIPLNIAAAGVLGKKRAEARADRCYPVEKEAERLNLKGAELRRHLRRNGCLEN